jgi:hypothetical protein
MIDIVSYCVMEPTANKKLLKDTSELYVSRSCFLSRCCSCYFHICKHLHSSKFCERNPCPFSVRYFWLAPIQVDEGFLVFSGFLDVSSVYLTLPHHSRHRNPLPRIDSTCVSISNPIFHAELLMPFWPKYRFK